MNSPMLRVEHLSLLTRRTQRPLIQDVSFDLAGGERLALIGPPEAGKSLLLKLLNRLIQPTHGQIYLNGDNLLNPVSFTERSASISNMRQRVMLVLPESSLLGRSAREALLYPLKLRRLTAVDRQERLLRCIADFQIPENWLDLPESMLSERQRRWVAIARALITEPQVLLLDSPLPGLTDTDTQHLTEILTQFTQDASRSLICVASDWDWLASHSTRAIYLKQGAIVRDQQTPNIDWKVLQSEIERLASLESQDWD